VQFYLFNIASLEVTKITRRRASVIFGMQFERRSRDNTQIYVKNEKYKLYSRVFGIFLPNFTKKDVYNFQLYRFKVGAFFWDTVYIGLANNNKFS